MSSVVNLGLFRHLILPPLATPTNASSTRSGLLRDLGASQAISIVVGVVIGSGIFLVPAEMMQSAGLARLVYLAWIVGEFFLFLGPSLTRSWAR